jgi:hypothetical protein
LDRDLQAVALQLEWLVLRRHAEVLEFDAHAIASDAPGSGVSELFPGLDCAQREGAITIQLQRDAGVGADLGAVQVSDQGVSASDPRSRLTRSAFFVAPTADKG